MNTKNKLSRRDFLNVLGALGGSVIIQSCQETSPMTRMPNESSPNIILILTDDQPPDTIDLMPILQKELAGKGISFTNSFVSTPLCSPSRASILTGQYAHNHGVLKNRYPDGGAEAFDDSSTIATWLHNFGYRTSFIGKYINGYDNLTPVGYIPPGWDDFQVFFDAEKENRFYYDYTLNENGKLVKYGERTSHYSTDVLTKKAVNFIRKTRNQAFFLILSFYTPHQPRTSAKRHNDMFKTDEDVLPRRPPNFNEEDISDKPQWVDDELANPHTMDKAYQKSLRSLMSVDEAIPKLLDAVHDIDQDHNTAIIYYADNGEAWGEHRLKEAKNCPYEECTRVPLVIYYPKLIPESNLNNQMVLNIDLAPTIADLAGVSIPSRVDGLSLIPLLINPAADWRNHILIEHWPTDEGHGSTIPEFSAIRTEEWKYVEYVNGEKELYDLVNDPYEMENLANEIKFESLMSVLATHLQKLRKN